MDPFDADVPEAASLPMAALTWQVKLHAVPWTCMLAKDQTAGVCTAERYTFTVTHDFGMLWKRHDSLTSNEKEAKNGLHIQELLNAILLPAILAS